MNWTLDKDKSEEEKIYLGEFRRWFKVVFMTTNPMNFQFQLKLKYGQEKSDRKLLLAVTEELEWKETKFDEIFKISNHPLNVFVTPNSFFQFVYIWILLNYRHQVDSIWFLWYGGSNKQ